LDQSGIVLPAGNLPTEYLKEPLIHPLEHKPEAFPDLRSALHKLPRDQRTQLAWAWLGLQKNVSGIRENLCGVGQSRIDSPWINLALAIMKDSSNRPI
jgi:hypothetical protein